MAVARVFWNGRSQAVRLPKEFRFDADVVRVSRDGDRVILEPIPKDEWGDDFWDILGTFGDDFDVGDRTTVQERELFE
jgi:antitoxin VapB